jgi:PTS system nitrogen regulatory IIA component
MPHRTLSIREVAEYLHVSEEEVRELVRAGEIPHERLGGRVVFRVSQLDAWASRRVLGLGGRALAQYHRDATQSTAGDADAQCWLPRLIRPEYIEPSLDARTRPSVLRAVTRLAARTGWVLDPHQLLQTLEARERLAPTALPGGVAILHPEHHFQWLFEDSFVLLARTPCGIPFGGPDGMTTDIFFLLACRSEREHLPLLARLCLMCHRTDLLEQLRHLNDREQMYDALLAAEREVVESA